MSTSSSSQNLHPSQGVIGQYGFGSASHCMSFIQLVKNTSFFGILEHLERHFSDFLCSKEVSKSLCDTGYDLLLLELIIKDWDLLAI
jgi:hypothetical protein